MIFFVVIAIAILAFMLWQLLRAKQFTRFKLRVHDELKPLIINHIKEELNNNRSELFPNTPSHIEASLLFWTSSTARIVQYALENEIIDQNWLKTTKNYRHCQHLFHIEQALLLPKERIKSTVEEEV